jgi:hypothetical protein
MNARYKPKAPEGSKKKVMDHPKTKLRTKRNCLNPQDKRETPEGSKKKVSQLLLIYVYIYSILSYISIIHQFSILYINFQAQGAGG